MEKCAKQELQDVMTESRHCVVGCGSNFVRDQYCLNEELSVFVAVVQFCITRDTH